MPRFALTVRRDYVTNFNIERLSMMVEVITRRNIGFDDEAFDTLIKYEDWHWWFQCRNSLITKTISKFSKINHDILEIGCGNGLVTKAIQDRYPESNITATEFLENGLFNARERLSGVTFQKLDARDIDGENEFDIVCAFDVLEHIDTDVEVMKSIRKLMKDDHSRFYITVPQHMLLWSQADTYAKHERRYSYEEMRRKLSLSGFEIEYRSSYVFLLSPLMFLSRLLNRKNKNFSIEREFEISKLTNALLSGVMKLEEILRDMALPMPFGGSLIVVARPV